MHLKLSSHVYSLYCELFGKEKEDFLVYLFVPETVSHIAQEASTCSINKYGFELPNVRVIGMCQDAQLS